jgi:WD40 repeat protein/predicted Ser/Thr protein kinase
MQKKLPLLTTASPATPSEPDTGAEPVRQVFGRYQVLRELGRGGMGVVYQADDPQLKRHVALKIIGQLQNQAKARERFDREASVMARLDHPNIVKIFDVGEQDGYSFFTMEFIAGQGLDKLLTQGLPLMQLIRLLTQVANAVEYAHSHGVIHRDLKPANILVTHDLQPKVMDFGLAKDLGERGGRLSKSQDIVGTPEYMSPEQVSGKSRKPDARSDVYSLGIILYEILAGRTPFSGSNPMAMLYQIGCTEPLPPSHFVPRISRELEAICLKAIEKNKDKRYQNSRELAADLERYQRREPVLAKPATPAVRAWKWINRHRVVCSLAALLVVTVVGFVISLMYQRKLAEQATKREEEAKLQEQKGKLRAQKETLCAQEETLCAQETALQAILDLAQAKLVLAKAAIDKRVWLEAAERRQEAATLLQGKNVAETLQRLGEKSRQYYRANFLRQACNDIEDYVISHYPHSMEKVSCNDLAVPSQPSWKFNVRRKDDEPILIYDMSTGKNMPLLENFKPMDYAIAFSEGNQWVALGNENGDVVLWKIGDSQLTPLGNILQKLDQPAKDKLHAKIRRLRFSPDSKWLCAASERYYGIWQLANQQCVLQHIYASGSPCIAFSRDSKRVAVGNFPTVDLFVLDALGTGKLPSAKIKAMPVALAFGVQGKTLIVGQQNDILIIRLPGKDSSELKDSDVTILDAHTGRIDDLALSHDETCFASAGEDKRVVVWSAYFYRKLWESKLVESTGHIFLAFHEASGCLGVWKKPCIESYALQTKWQHCLELSKRPEMQILRTLKGLQTHALARTRGQEEVEISFTPDGKYLAFALVGRVYLWNLLQDTISELYNSLLQAKALVFHNNSQLFASVRPQKQRQQPLYGWNLVSQERNTVSPHINNVCFHPTLPLVASDEDGRIRIWKLENLALVLQQEWTWQNKVISKTFDAKGQLLALTTHNKAEVWRLAGDTSQHLATVTIGGWADGCVTLTDEGELVMGSENGDVWITDWQSWPQQEKPGQQPLVPVLRLSEAVKKIWYDTHRHLYWIYTQNGLCIYPELTAEAKAADASLRQSVDEIYPLPWHPGYPILAAEISADFTNIAVMLQSGEIGVMSLGAAHR